MNAPSSVPGAIDALVTTWTNALSPGVLVLDGPGTRDDAAQRIVFVGVEDPDVDGATQSVTGAQKWATTGYTRDETFDIHCTALAWNGEGDQKAARDNAFALLQTLVDTLLSDSTFGAPGVLYAPGITSFGLTQNQDSQGAEAQLHFAVTFRARI